MMDLFTLQTIGKVRQEELLKEAADGQRFTTLGLPANRAFLKTLRATAGKSLITIGRFLARSAVKAEPNTDMKWKTS